MSFEHPPLIALPTGLCDADAAKLLDWLYELAATVQSHYAGQLHRYDHCRDERQQALWPAGADDEPPF